MKDDGSSRERLVQLSEAQTLVMATLAGVGSWVAVPVATPLALVAVVAAFGWRRPWMFVIAVGVLASARGHAENLAYQPLPAGAFDGTISLVTDPEAMSFGWFGEARVLGGDHGGRRVRITVPWTAGDLGDAVAGSTLTVAGAVSPLDDGSFVRSRHLVGRLTVTSIDSVSGPRWWRLPSELVRERVVAGAVGVPVSARPLYVGLVIGDDREQSIAQRARFRAVGMSHLLAVSGQNVAFVLAVAAPALKRRSRRGRWVITVALLLTFAVATRLEPSVVRATVSAGIAATAVISGRRSAGVRTLALAATVLLLVDPFLIWSIGFLLSVIASLGIVLFGTVLAQRIRGPRWFAEGLAITVAAQLAVAPLLIAVFGPVSLASLPANVASGFAAGAVMTWGSSVGIVVGLMPDAWRSPVSLPATVLVWWIDMVARVAALLPLPAIGAVALVLMIGSCFVFAVAGPVGRRIGAGLIAVALVASSFGRDALPGRIELDGGAQIYSGAHTVLVVGGDARPAVVEALLDHRVRSIDVVVMLRGDRRSADLAAAIADVAAVGVVLAPPQHRIIGARRLLETTILDVGGFGGLCVAPDGDTALVVGCDAGTE